MDTGQAASELNQQAFDAVMSWHVSADAANAGALTRLAPVIRSLLWWRVARCLRPESESAGVRQAPATAASPGSGFLTEKLAPAARAAFRAFKRATRAVPSAMAAESLVKGTARGSILLPQQHSRWDRTITALQAGCGELRILQSRSYTRIQPSRAQRQQATAAAKDIRTCLHKRGIELLGSDVRELREDIANRLKIITVLQRAMQQRPDLVVVANDSDSPFIEAITVAREFGVPSLMIQHGLDCDPLVCDIPEADYIATWGPERATRYSAVAGDHGREIRVTGNPEYDDLPSSTDATVKNASWLLTTRPNTLQRCALPSQSPSVGAQIFAAVLESLSRHPTAQLVLKPHRADNMEVYEEQLKRLAVDVRSRVEIQQRPLEDLLSSASLVITQDSTAALDAVLHQKPIIHAHFGLADPVLPLVRLQAAKPARSSAELIASIDQLVSESVSDCKSMASGCDQFLRQFHPHDGHASERLSAFLMDIIAHTADTSPD